MKKIVILVIAFIMVFSSFVIIFNVNPQPPQPGISNQNVISKSPIFVPYTGAGSSQTISAELNYTQAGVSTTFDKIQASVSHTQFDIGQSVTIHFSNAYVCKNPVSGMPPNSTGKMVIEEQSPTTTFLKSHYANVTYSSTEEATTYANFTDDFTSTIVFTFFVEAYVDYSETGKDYKNVSAAITISVNADPSVSISDNQAVSGYVDTNTTVKFTSSANGGWIPYTYQWFTNGGALSGQTSSTYTKDFTSPGTYKDISVCTTDATGYVVLSNLITDQVAYPPKVNISATQQKVDANQHVEFFSNLIHGNGKVSLTWSINGTTISSQTGRDLNETFKGSGHYNIRVTAEDQADYVVSSNITEVVYPPISSKLIISKQYIDVGQEVNFKANVTGSSQSYTGSYTLTYTNDESTLTTGEGLQFNFTFPDESPFNCYAVALNWKITSSVGSVTYANDSEICIHIDPTISIAEEYSSRDVKIDDKFTSSGPFSTSSTIGVYGGWKPYKVTWQYENLSVGKWENITTTLSDSSSSTTYAFSLAGTYEIRAHLVDNANYQVNSSEIEVTINPALRLNVTITPSKMVHLYNSEVFSGNVLCLSVTQTGGSSISGVNVGDLDLYCCNTDFSTNDFGGHYGCNVVLDLVSEKNPVKVQSSIPNLNQGENTGLYRAGKYEYRVAESDETGGSAVGYANFTVVSSDMSITTNVPSITVQGNSYSLDASASAPSYFKYTNDFNLIGYSYEWHIGKTNISGKSTVFDFSKAGTYTINLTVKANYETDYNGQELTAYQEKTISQTVRVVNSSSSTNIHIKQVRYKTSGNYYFNYWISFTDSSYSTSFYSINHTAYTPQVIQPYANGSVFVNVSIQDNDYSPGTQDIYFTVINNDSQTNTVNNTFIISIAQSNQISIYTIANFFGGFYNFVIFIATIGTLVIGYVSFRDSRKPPIIQLKQSDGKTESYRMQGKKVK